MGLADCRTGGLLLVDGWMLSVFGVRQAGAACTFFRSGLAASKWRSNLARQIPSWPLATSVTHPRQKRRPSLEDAMYRGALAPFDLGRLLQE